MNSQQKLEYARKLRAELECTKLWNRKHDKQKEFHLSTKHIRCFIGGNRVGKTTVGAQETNHYIFNSHESRQIKLPIEVWVCCPSYDSQVETTQKKLQAMIPPHRIKHIEYATGSAWKRVEIDNGCVITFKSYEQGREKYQGAAKRLIWFDEEPPKDIWEECSVRHEAGQSFDIILTMTPINGMGWVYSDLYLNTTNSDVFVITAGWEDNPWLTGDQIGQMSRGLSEDALQVRRWGKFVKRTGLVCNWWDRGVHLANSMPIQSAWNIYRIIDFGWSSSKTCVLWVGVDSDDRVYVFDGVYENELSDEKLAAIIKEREQGFRVTKAISDNTPDRINTLKLNGVNSEPIEKKTSGAESWDTVRAEAMAAIGRIDPVTKQSRLQVSSTLTYFDPDKGGQVNWFVSEIERLRWKEKKTETGVMALASWNKEETNGSNHYDAIDCFSYFAITYTRKGQEYKEPTTIRIKEQARIIVNPLTGY